MQRLPRGLQRGEAGALCLVLGGKCKNSPVLDVLKEKGKLLCAAGLWLRLSCGESA